MSELQARGSAKIMLEADLNGMDSHGVAILIYYEGLFKNGAINPTPNIRIERETPATALIDADGALGHSVSIQAMSVGGPYGESKCRRSRHGRRKWYVRSPPRTAKPRPQAAGGNQVRGESAGRGGPGDTGTGGCEASGLVRGGALIHAVPGANYSTGVQTFAEQRKGQRCAI